VNSMPNPSAFVAAVVQHAPVFMNLAASLDKACALTAEAAAHGARVVAFPETWLPGYPVWLDVASGTGLWDHAPAKALYRVLVENALVLDSPVTRRLGQVAREHDVTLVMGAHERVANTLYNSILYFPCDGGEPTVHRKLVPTYTERLLWGRGDGSTLRTLATPHGPVGGLVCWEHWMPLARAAMHDLGETVHVAQWPYVKELHQIASRHYAFEGQCFVLAAGAVLSRDEMLAGVRSLGDAACDALPLLESVPQEAERLLRGGSAIIAPDTSYLAGPLYDEAGILYAELDPACITEGHMALDTSGHYARPDVFHLSIDTRPQTRVTWTPQPPRDRG